MLLHAEAKQIFDKAGEYGPRARAYVLEYVAKKALVLGLKKDPLPSRVEAAVRAAIVDAGNDVLPATIGEAMKRYGITAADVSKWGDVRYEQSTLVVCARIFLPAGLAGELASSVGAKLFEAILELAGLAGTRIPLAQRYAELGDAPPEVKAQFDRFWGMWAPAAADYYDRDRIAGFIE